VLIELQGKLDVGCTDNSERDGQVVGMFRLEEGSSKPTIAIGHHLLEGKIVSLPKPLGVIHRSTLPPVLSQNAHEQDPTEGDGVDRREAKGSDAGTSRWDMVAVVKKKIVFSKRPMPIVGKAAAVMGTSR